MPKHSAGLLMFRRRNGGLEVLLVHPGGPFWVGKDTGAWFIPKGQLEPGEDELSAAQREFREETGLRAVPPFLPLGEVSQRSGKLVTVFAFEGDCDPDAIRSNTFAMEWPPKSGRMQEFPEVDQANWFNLPEARAKMHPAEAEFLVRLGRVLAR